MSDFSPPNHHSESSGDLPFEPPTVNQNSVDDGRPSGEMTPPSPSPLTPFDGQETDNLCQNTDLLNVVDSLKTENQLEIGSNSDPPDWDAIPLPPFERICHKLYNANDGTDLANLAKVSTHYNKAVMKFMSGPNNRPGIEDVEIMREGDKLMVLMTLFPSNLPFYDLASLDKRRFNRVTYRGSPSLEVKLTGPEDPIIEKGIPLLAAAISTVKIDAECFSFSSLSLCEQLLRSSTIDAFEIEVFHLSDSIAPLVLSIASHAKKIEIYLTLGGNSQDLSDPASFIVQLDSMPRLSSVHIDDLSSPFFGLPNSFWENYLNEKLSNGSIEWVEVERLSRERKIKAPIGLNPDERIFSLKWEKNNISK